MKILDNKQTLVFFSDWINSRPVFYNTKTLKISHSINDVIDYSNLELDPEGFNNYLEFGYSVFGQTPVKNVKFLEPSSSITNENNQIKITCLKDSVDDYYNQKFSVDDVIDKIRAYVQTWESTMEGDIIIPLSGGYDSRLLAAMLKNPSRARSFTYGITLNQSQCSEVLYAQAIAKQLGIQWQQVELGKFHQYIDEWHALYGPSVHTHGMYHMEFYSKLNSLGICGGGLISGAYGDIFSGNVSIPSISCYEKTILLGRNHQICANGSQSLISSNSQLKEEFYLKKRERLENLYYRIVEHTRMKSMLLSYLANIPTAFNGFNAFLPYINEDIALSMLRLDPKVWEDRKWQVDFFRKQNLYVEDTIQVNHGRNTLDLYATVEWPLELLSENTLAPYINRDYIMWINKHINHKRIKKILYYPEWRNKLRGRYFLDSVRAYNAYMTLLPIQDLLKKRDHRR